jgi:uncharacterized protein YjbI with pentapeptide repeats
MEILNNTKFRIAYIPGRINFPGHSLTCIIKGTFDLKNGTMSGISDEQIFPTGDETYPDNEDPLSGPLYESDFACFKPRADLLLVGKCYIPDGKYSSAAKVTFQIGTKKKSAAVFGDRYWKRNAFGVGVMSDAEVFNNMPLTYENSFGGPGFKANPGGKGYSKEDDAQGKKIRKLPNIEDPGNLIDSPGSKTDPAGFGPVNRQWQLRQSKMGTYKGDYLDKRWPWFPEDFDYSHYNAAPPDMQVEGYLRGDEKLYFENLHPEHAQYRSQLPGLRIRCFINKKIQPQSEETTFNEVSLNLDTLWVDMETEKLVLVWRAWTEVQSEEYEEIEHVFIMSELLKENPQTKDQCHGLFLTALDEYEAEWAGDTEESEEPEPTEEAEPPEPEIPEVKPPPEAAAPAKMSKSELTQHIETQTAAIFAQLGISMAALPPDVQQQTKELQQKLIEKMTEEDPAKLAAMELEENEAKVKEELDKIGIDYDNLPALSEKAKSEKQLLLREMGIQDAEIAENEALTESWQILAAVMPQIGLDPENLDTLIEKARPQLEKIKEQLGLGVAEDAGEKEDDERQKAKGKRQKEPIEGVEDEEDDSSVDEGDDVVAEGEVKDVDINQKLADGESLAGIDLSGHDFSGQELSGVDFSGAILAGAILSGVNLEGAVLANTDLKKSDLSGANMAGANLAQTDLSGANLENANLEGADLTECMLDSANLKKSQLTDATFEKAKLTTANLEEVIAVGTVFTEADMTGSSCKGADFNLSDLTHCLLHNVNFQNANLNNASVEGAQGKNINCTEANLTKLRASERCDFSGGNFSKCTCEESIWHEANLTNADFTYSKMEGADFSKCNLEKANLSGSDIKSGRFAKANLQSAKMIMSNLFESSLEKADLTYTDLSQSNMYAAEFLDAIIDGTKFNGTNLKMTKLADKKK